MARLLCVLFGLIGALPIAAEGLMTLPSTQGWAARETRRVLAETLGVEATFEVQLHLIPLKLRVLNLSVASADGGSAALVVDEITVRPRLLSLLSARLDLGDIEVKSLRARAVVRDGKLSNVRYKTPERAKPSSRQKSPFGALAVSDARLDLDLEGTRIRTGPIDLDVFVDRGPSFEIALRAGRTTIERNHPPPGAAPNAALLIHDEDVACRFDVRARVAGSDVLVRRLSLLAAADQDPGKGTIPDCSALPVDAQVALRLSQMRVTLREGDKPFVAGRVVARAPLFLVQRFARILPWSGWLGFAGEVHYDGRQRAPDLEGQLTGAGVGVGNYRLARELKVRLNVTNDTVNISRYEMGFADGWVVAQNARIAPFANGVPISVERVDATGIRFEGLMRDLDVTPHTVVRWNIGETHVRRVEGTLWPLQLDSELEAITKDFEVFDRGFDDPQRRHMIGVRAAVVRGRIGVTPGALLIHDTGASFGQSRLLVKRVSIGFDNHIELLVSQGSKLELSDVSPIVDVPWSGSTELDVEMSGISSDPVLTGNLKIAGFEMGGFPIGDLTSAKARFRPLFVELKEVHAKKGESEFSLPMARLDFGTRASILVEARAQSERLDVRDFLAMWHFDEDPRFDPIRGHTSVDASIRYVLGGPEDRCRGGVLRTSGLLASTDLELFDEGYDAGSARFDMLWDDRDAGYRGLTLRVPELSLQKGSGSVTGSLQVTPGAVLAGELLATGVPLSHIDALPSRIRAADGTSSATASLGGTLDAISANADVTLSSMRIGRATLPPSSFKVHLEPIPRPKPVIGHTRCGQPRSPDFDRAEYDRDLPDGIFHLKGQMFQGQIAFDDVQVTRQRKKTAKGRLRATRLDVGAALELNPEVLLGSERVTGSASGTLDLEQLKLDDPVAARGVLSLSNLSLTRGGASLELLGESDPIRFADRGLSVAKAAIAFKTPRGPSTVVDLTGQVENLGPAATIDAELRMRPTPLAGLAALLPGVERASGSLEGKLLVVGPWREPHYSGGFQLERGGLTLEALPFPLSDMELKLRLDGSELSLEDARAKLGGGTISVTGGALVHGLRLGNARLRIRLRDISLPLGDGIRSVANAELLASIGGSSEGGARTLPQVTGNVLLHSLEYRRPVTITADLNALAQRGRRTEFEAYDPSEERVAFDLNIKAERPLEIDTDLVEAKLTLADEGLRLQGTNARHGLHGRVQIQPGGRITLRRSEFEITDGTVRFDDSIRVAPQVDVSAVTEYRRYSDAPGEASAGTASTVGSSSSATGGRWNIRLHAYGDADNLKVDLTSDPALAQDDIFLLLTVGLTRAELDQAQSASVGESVALEALGTLTGADRAVKDVVPLIDEFSFGSAYSSRTGRTEPTVTVGKRLGERVRGNVTTGLAESREIRSNLEWRLSPRVSVETSYDNVNDISSSALGNLGADVRWRLEFE